jgi:hypothetical protein
MFLPSVSVCVCVCVWPLTCFLVFLDTPFGTLLHIPTSQTQQTLRQMLPWSCLAATYAPVPFSALGYPATVHLDIYTQQAFEPTWSCTRAPPPGKKTEATTSRMLSPSLPSSLPHFCSILLPSLHPDPHRNNWRQVAAESAESVNGTGPICLVGGETWCWTDQYSNDKSSLSSPTVLLVLQHPQLLS